MPPDQKLHKFELDYIERVRASLAPSVPDAIRDQAAAYAETLIQRGFPVLFDQQHLSLATGIPSQVIGTIRRDPRRFYSEFRVAKRSGGSRLVRAPSPRLKRIQHWMQRRVTSKFRSHDHSHGFVRGKSPVTNAEPHVGAAVILKLDLLDFFGNVDRRAAYRAYKFAGYSRAVAHLLADLSTLDGVLPQGAPTSPDLANMAAYRLDVRLTKFAENNSLTYTRYADDLTFSGSFTPRVQRAIEYIIRDEGFSPNERKLRYLLQDQRQSVTGITVNEKLNWPRWRRRWLRQEIYYVSRFGLEAHLGARGIEKSRYKEFIYGHVYALHAARPGEADELLSELDRVEWPY